MAVAGWYADPYGAQGQLRYWDGTQWTANVMPRPSSAPMQAAAGAASGPVGAQGGQGQAQQAAQAQAQAAQAAQIQPRTIHESIPLGASGIAAPTAGAYNYQGQPTDQQFAAQQGQAQAQSAAYGAAQGQPGYAQVANAYEAAAQGYAQAANAYDAAAQGYAQVGSYEAAQGYGQYDSNAQAYGQAGVSAYYPGYDPYQQAGQTPVQAPEGSNRTLRLIAFVLYIVAIVGVVALVVVLALSFFGVIYLGSYSYSSGFDLFAAETPLVFLTALPLAWLIPMCIHTLGILKGKKRNTVLFGVLTLLFCGLLPGLFLLLAKKDPKPAPM